MTAPSSATTTLRTHRCGELRSEHAGQTVTLGGWVHRNRDLGALVFLDLRDRDGIVQVSFDAATGGEDTLRAAAAVGVESVVLVEGEVALRPADRRNPEMPTGDVELRARSFRVVGPATTPAIPVARGRTEGLASEELRLRHRYLDLRRPELQHSIILRHRLMQATRRFLSERGFLEIETPILTKPTPEGARDYLVPSRVHEGEFYALPQSPQLYKQLLMISGYDRYFQIARCFRDEDLRADRQPEFTQIDIEASFVGVEDILGVAEGLVGALWREGGQDAPARFRRMKYSEAMERYGSDKPDLRYGLELVDFTAVFTGAPFEITARAIEAGGRVRGIRIPAAHAAPLSRKVLDEVAAAAKSLGAREVLTVKNAGGIVGGKIGEALGADAAARLGVDDGGLVLLVAGPDHVTSPSLDRVRQEIAHRLGSVPADAREFLIVEDFPMFERDPKSGALAPLHHPFTSPHPDDLPLLDSDPVRVRALAYDVVLNGMELGGGSIRIGDPELQARVLRLLGIDDETARVRFGFLLEALRSGAPPHGGIAFGLDRIAMLLSGAGSLRDVIAFPKTTAARALFEGAPTPVNANDLEDLHLRLLDGAAEARP